MCSTTEFAMQKKLIIIIISEIMDKFIVHLGSCLITLPLFILSFLVVNGISAAIFMWIWNTYVVTTFVSSALPFMTYWPSFWIVFMVRMLITPAVNFKSGS